VPLGGLEALDADILLVGGLGYLGYNIARYYASRGAAGRVLVVARRRSAERRRVLLDLLRRLGVNVDYSLESLSGGAAERFIAARGCPRLVYLLTGKLRGARRLVWEANVEVPRSWAEALAASCPGAVVVYASTVAAAGDASACASDGVVVEEEEHLRGCRPLGEAGEAKAEAERRLLQLCDGLRVLILRLGLLVGEAAYHREWRLFLRLAGLGLAPQPRDVGVNITPAMDVAGAAEAFAAGGEACSWAYAAPWRVGLADIVEALAAALGRRVVRVPVPAALLYLTREGRLLVKLGRYRYATRRGWLRSYPWTPARKALEEAARWLASSRHILKLLPG